MNEIQSKIDIARSEHNMISEKYSTARNNLQSAMDKITEAQRVVTECESKISHFRKKLSSSNAELSDSVSILASVEQQEVELVAAVRAAHAKLEEHTTTVQQAKAKSSVLELLTSESKKGTHQRISRPSGWTWYHQREIRCCHYYSVWSP